MTARIVARASLALASVIALGACSTTPQDTAVTDDTTLATDSPAIAEGAMLTADQQADGWRSLFDGSTTDGWRGFRRDDMPDGWQVIDGALTRVAAGGDIITTDQFEDFELSLEWKLREGGNSGIMYRVSEETERTYESGPEMQVLDDAVHVDGQSQLTSAGAAYGLYPAPRGVVRPVGEWNAVRIVVDGNNVEHWLNGQRIVLYELQGDDWERRVRESKFIEWPMYGRVARGHIALQDHDDWVAYRNIRIRELP